VAQEGIDDGCEDLEGIDVGSSLGLELGIDEDSEDGCTDGFEDFVSLRVKDGIEEGSEDGCIDSMFEDGCVEGVALPLGWALQDGAVEGVVVGEELVDGLAVLAVFLDFFIWRRFEPFPPSSHSPSLGLSLRGRDLDKGRKH
jgi:hypothetical protein